jgi:hypothetical protein
MRQAAVHDRVFKPHAADAALAAFALSLPVSYDATSRLSRLYNAIREAR